MPIKVPVEEFWAVYLSNNRNAYATANQLNMTHSAACARAKRLAAQFDKDAKVVVAPLPDPDLPLDDIKAAKMARFERLQAHEDAAKLIPIKIRDSGVIGIVFFGDPHLDNDGTDLRAFERHTQLVEETDGLYACNVGDVTDNWIGRLARLYAESSTTEWDAWRLAQHYLTRIRHKLLFLIGGNHDLWSGGKDPLRWIMSQNRGIYRPSECRVEVTTADGCKFRINARHDFKGGSMWNAAHAPAKALIMGVRDHIAVCGHYHESAHNEIKCPETGRNMHAIKVASYKWIDRFARDHGFRDQKLSPAAVTLIDTRLPDTHPDFIKVYWDVEQAVCVLTALRRKAA